MAAYDSRNLHLVELNDANLTIYIPPWMCNQVEAGVYDELDNTLLRCWLLQDSIAAVADWRSCNTVLTLGLHLVLQIHG